MVLVMMSINISSLSSKFLDFLLFSIAVLNSRFT